MKKTGWLFQPGLRERGLPFERNNPFTFHGARFFHLAGERIPMADKILETFMKVQEENGSWKLGNVHGTFDALRDHPHAERQFATLPTRDQPGRRLGR